MYGTEYIVCQWLLPPRKRGGPGNPNLRARHPYTPVTYQQTLSCILPHCVYFHTSTYVYLRRLLSFLLAVTALRIYGPAPTPIPALHHPASASSSFDSLKSPADRSSIIVFVESGHSSHTTHSFCSRSSRVGPIPDTVNRSVLMDAGGTIITVKKHRLSGSQNPQFGINRTQGRDEITYI